MKTIRFLQGSHVRLLAESFVIARVVDDPSEASRVSVHLYVFETLRALVGQNGSMQRQRGVCIYAGERAFVCCVCAHAPTGTC